MVAIDKRKVLQWCYNNIENISLRRNNEELIGRCPICGDSKKDKKKRRFYLNFSMHPLGVAHCFNCNWSGTAVSLIEAVEQCSKEEAKNIAGINRWIDIKDKLVKKSIIIKGSAVDKKEIKKQELSVIEGIVEKYSFPLSTVDSELGTRKKLLKKRAIEFLLQRCLLPNKYKYFVGYEGKYINRLIIPIWNKYSQMVFFQGRALSPTMLPKYLNPSVAKEDIVFGEGNFDKNLPVIFFEGILDVLSLYQFGYKNVSCSLGAVIVRKNIEKILQEIDKEVIICLDNDQAGIDGMLNVYNMFKGESRVKFFLISNSFGDIYKDVNEIVQTLFQNKQQNVINIIKKIIRESVPGTMLELCIKVNKLKKKRRYYSYENCGTR